LWKSVDNYYLLAFKENLKCSPKQRRFVFYSETWKNIEKLRVAHHHESLILIWKKNFLKFKNELYKKKEIEKSIFK